MVSVRDSKLTLKKAASTDMCPDRLCPAAQVNLSMSLQALRPSVRRAAMKSRLLHEKWAGNFECNAERRPHVGESNSFPPPCTLWKAFDKKSQVHESEDSEEPQSMEDSNPTGPPYLTKSVGMRLRKSRTSREMNK